MGKETRERKNQINSAPYNVSNSSFARRITSKVAEYIAPTWASGWLQHLNNEQSASTSLGSNCTQVQVEINNVENSSRPSLPNHNNIIHSNNKTAVISKSHALGNETCSPILNSDRHNNIAVRGFQSAGPSGYSQPNKPGHNIFVASTPAITISKPDAENGSESGDSTSGCSSLVSQSNKLRLVGMGDVGKTKSLFPHRQIPTDEISKSHNKSSGPQFDTSLFNSSSPSLNKSVNLSPFYPGRTMYGGASNYRKYSIGSNKSTTSPSIFQPSLRRASMCNQPRVNPSPTSLPKMSVIAENILKTINAMTPVTRVMSMPRPEEVNSSPVSLRGAGVKRKLPELQIPTLVNSNLLQLKGSERKNVLSQRMQEVLSSSSDEDLNYAIVSNDAKRSLKKNMKRLKRGKSQDEEMQTEVNLPHAVLDVPSLPVIDIDIGKSSLDVAFSDPFECRDFNMSSESSLLSVSSNSSELTSVKNNPSTCVNFVYNSESNNSNPKPRVNIMDTPQQVSTNKTLLSSPKVLPASTSSTWDCDVCLNKGNPSGGLCKACHKPHHVNTNIETTAKPATSLVDRFKPSPDMWECKECFVQNKSNATACVCCRALRPGAKIETTAKPATSLVDQFKPSPDMWGCKECFVQNKSNATACVCCRALRPGAKVSTNTPVSSAPLPSTTSGGFGDMFKKPTGNWDCSVCMISNKSSDDKCVACETAKPGSVPKAPAPSNLMTGPKFPFSTLDGSTFKFGMDKVDTVDKPALTISAAPKFSFGIPSTSNSTAQTSTTSTSLPAFSFGMTKTQESPSTDQKETTSSVLTSTSSTIVSAPSTSNTTVISMPLSSSPASSPCVPPLPMFKSSLSQASSPSPGFSIKSTISSPSTTVPVSSASSFNFGTSNGPLVNSAESKTVPKPVENKPEVKESPKPLFGAAVTSFLNNTSEKPINSMFGNPTPAVTKQSNAFETSKVQFGITPTTNGGEPPSKMIDFGKPAAVEPPKPSIFGAAVFEKPKESSLFGSISNTAPPAFPASKPVENNLFSFGSSPSKPVANAFSSSPTPSASVFRFGSPVVQSNNFAAPAATAAPAFNFNATSNNSSTFAAAPQTLQTPMFNPGNNMFTPTPAPAPMFSGLSNPNPTPFTFGATPLAANNTSGGFAFGAQNSTQAQSSGGFSFGAPHERPSFNFTAGTASPIFSAQPGLTAGSNPAVRKYKKAMRRKF